MLQILLNVTEFGMNAADAVAAPRIHHQWLPNLLYHEAGFSPDTLRLLQDRGHTVAPRLANNDANAVRLHEGWLEGAVDPRREGVAEGL